MSNPRWATRERSSGRASLREMIKTGITCSAFTTPWKTRRNTSSIRMASRLRTQTRNLRKTLKSTLKTSEKKKRPKRYKLMFKRTKTTGMTRKKRSASFMRCLRKMTGSQVLCLTTLNQCSTTRSPSIKWRRKSSMQPITSRPWWLKIQPSRDAASLFKSHP